MSAIVKVTASLGPVVRTGFCTLGTQPNSPNFTKQNQAHVVSAMNEATKKLKLWFTDGKSQHTRGQLGLYIEFEGTPRNLQSESITLEMPFQPATRRFDSVSTYKSTVQALVDTACKLIQVYPNPYLGGTR